MKISKETWKDILKIVGTIIATIASVLGVQAMPLLKQYYKTKKVSRKPKYILQAHLFKK